MDDDGDEWRVVRVKRGASKGKTPVESAFPRGVGGHGKRENTNAFQALAGPRDDGDDGRVMDYKGDLDEEGAPNLSQRGSVCARQSKTTTIVSPRDGT